ncbi:hypothetical protein [Aeoliella sp. SH292]|uniref:hypothetical protein n=1 Tax=Aeoliella sp. SH292 TaxID=3454464 RepID=UPI003F9D1FD6
MQENEGRTGERADKLGHDGLGSGEGELALHFIAKTPSSNGMPKQIDAAGRMHRFWMSSS